MQPTKISVAVVAYNQEKYIAQCLDSIAAQKGAFDLEVVLADDCSTDKTRQLMQEYTKKHPDVFMLLPATANMGMARNVKRCLEACSGDYIATCDGDDYWTDPYKLQKQANFLETHPDYSLCFNAVMIYIQNENRYVPLSDQLSLKKDTLTTQDLIENNYIGNSSTCMYRSGIIRQLPEEIYNDFFGDWVLNMACGRLGKIGFIRDWMSVYRRHSAGVSSGRAPIERARTLSAAIDYYDQLFHYNYTTQFRKTKETLENYIDEYDKQLQHLGRQVPSLKKYGYLLTSAIRHPRQARNRLFGALSVGFAELTKAAVSSAVQAKDTRIAALNWLVYVIDGKLYTDLKELLNEIKIDFGGGCSLEKAYIMAWLIANFKLKSTVDIGVYRGRSLFPQALAHKKFSNGIVYGIDPWDKELARKYDNKELKQAIDDFLDKTDFSEIGRQVARYNSERGFNDHCVLIQKKSEDAIAQFRDKNIIFDLIHIDGNYDTEMVMKDVDLYLPLLAEKGFVVMDDITWDSVKPAFDAVNSKYSLLYKKRDLDDDYAIFWDNNNKSEIAQLTSDIERIINGITTFRTWQESEAAIPINGV